MGPPKLDFGKGFERAAGGKGFQLLEGDSYRDPSAVGSVDFGGVADVADDVRRPFQVDPIEVLVVQAQSGTN